MSNKSLLRMAALMGAAMGGFKGIEDTYSPRHKKPTFKDVKERNVYKFTDSRQLREFSIKGHKVMAYSRKDAITRLKHQKKK